MELQPRPLSMVMLPEEDAPDSTTDVQPHPEATEDQLQEPDLLPGDQLLRLRQQERQQRRQQQQQQQRRQQQPRRGRGRGLIPIPIPHRGPARNAVAFRLPSAK